MTDVDGKLGFSWVHLGLGKFKKNIDATWVGEREREILLDIAEILSQACPWRITTTTMYCLCYCYFYCSCYYNCSCYFLFVCFDNYFKFFLKLCCFCCLHIEFSLLCGNMKPASPFSLNCAISAKNEKKTTNSLYLSYSSKVNFVFYMS